MFQTSFSLSFRWHESPLITHSPLGLFRSIKNKAQLQHSNVFKIKMRHFIIASDNFHIKRFTTRNWSWYSKNKMQNLPKELNYWYKCCCIAVDIWIENDDLHLMNTCQATKRHMHNSHHSPLTIKVNNSRDISIQLACKSYFV